MKRLNVVWVITFVGFLSIVSLANIISQDQKFSQAENRPLQQFPTFSIERFVSGTFSKDMDTYVRDQFVRKPFWTKLKASAQRALLKKENNGVYFGKDDYLFERFTKSTRQLEANSQSLNEFLSHDVEASVYGLLAPTSISVYPEKVPTFAPTESEMVAIETVQKHVTGDIQWIDAQKALKVAKDEPIYYRTDHHWTSRGAYIAYRETIQQMGLTPYDLDDFTIQTVSEDFRGTYDAKANDSFIRSDSIEIFEPKFSVQYDIDIDDGKSRMDSLYDWGFLEKRDKYSLFLGGNHRAVTIRSNIDSTRKLLVIKDSYAHSLIPFLANHFSEIYMVDLRYDHRSMKEIIKKKDIQDVLVVYNIATFAEDQNLVWLRH